MQVVIQRCLRACLTSLAVGLMLLAVGCVPQDSTGGGSGGKAGTASGGSVGSGGASPTGSGGASTTGSGGASTTGSGGATTGSGGASTTGSGGATTGSGGATTGSGGSGTATGGSGAGTGGRSGTATGGNGTGGAGTGTGGMSGGGSNGSAGAGAGDEYVSGVTVAVHPNIATVLVVSWTQAKAADQTWLEFSFAGSPVMKSRALAGATGAHKDHTLGTIASTAVTVRIVSKVGSVEYKTKDYMGMTNAVPSGMPKATVSMYDAAAASPNRYLVGAVENSTGGCTNDSCYFNGVWWLFAMDRQGRIVWYYADAATNDVSSFPQKARDGEYLFVEKRIYGVGGNPSVLKMTLDRQYYTMVSVPLLSDAVDMTNDGLLLYDTEERARGNAELREMNKSGTVRTIWKCNVDFGANFMCYTNTISWDPVNDAVLLSFPEHDTVAVIDRKAGTVLATYGSRAGSYTFSPSPWNWEWQHAAIMTAQGTLLISSHLPGFGREATAAPNHHSFQEFTIDKTAKTLTRKWMYGDGASDGTEWAYSRGMALRLANGNTLVNYGPGGVIREVTNDKKTVFYVKFDVATGNDYFNKLVGNTFLIDDLYALNGAPK